MKIVEIVEALEQTSEALENVILGYGIGISIPLSYCCIVAFLYLRQKHT
ncbi:hypothetical protein [Helicobacter ganmani]|nr:hypothetical protein [Helicobacter ganmani]